MTQAQTQTIIAQKAKISCAFLSELKNGKKRPSWHTAKRLASVTNTLPILWLEGSSEEIKQVLGQLGKDVAL